MEGLVAAGSNLGDRRALVGAALSSLGRLPRTRLLARSSLHETPPERPTDGGPFLNAAALIATELGPAELLQCLQDLERRAGRRSRLAGQPRGPRLLDLDLILLGPVTVERPGLVVPHPRFRQRRFVLAPAAEVAPWLRDPSTGRTVSELLAALDPPAARTSA